MNKNSGLFNFLLVVILVFIIVLQILSMIQSDRLYLRLNEVLDNLASKNFSVQQTAARNDSNSVGVEGDWLVWRFGAEPANLNPLTGKDVYNSWILGFVFESLLERDPDTLEFKPLLAESYNVSDDGLEITYELKEDIYFSDGEPITTDDIVFTYQTIMNPKVDAARLATYYKDIDRVEKIDDKQVKFIMKRKYFKSIEFTGGMLILPEHVYSFEKATEFNQRISNPVGSGPYKFQEWNVGKEIVLTKNENYWKTPTHINKIVFRFITNQIAALQSLKSKNVDYMNLTSEQYSDLIKDDKFVSDFHVLSYWTPLNGYNYIGWNQDTPYFNDRKVRLAMTHLIDREKINEHLLKGLGKIVTGPFYIKGKQSNPEIEPWPYDPQKAKKLLEDAGWIDTDNDGLRDKNGIPFKFKFMITSAGGLAENIAKVIKDEFAKVGIQMDIDTYEWSVFEERLNQRNYDAVTLGWSGSVENDPYQIWHSSQIKGRGSNYVGFDNPEADRLIEEARRTLDEDKRNKMYHRLHEIIHNQQPYTFLFTSTRKRALDGRFKNVKIHKLGLDEREWYVPKAEQRY